MTEDITEEKRKESKKRFGVMIDTHGNVIGEIESSIEIGKAKE